MIRTIYLLQGAFSALSMKPVIAKHAVYLLLFLGLVASQRGAVLALGDFTGLGSGLDIRGDIDKGIRAPILPLTYNEGKTFVSSITKRTYQVADQVHATDSPQQLYDEIEFDMKQISEYSQAQWRYRSFSLGLGPVAGFSSSRESREVQSLLRDGQARVYLVRRVIRMYDVSALPIYSWGPVAASRFYQDYVNLPDGFVGTGCDPSFDRFVAGYGSHTVMKASYGGELTYLVAVNRTYIEKKHSTYVRRQVSLFINAGLLGFGYSSGSIYNSTEIDKEFLENAVQRRLLRGGNQAAPDYHTWAASVLDSPALISNDITPILHVITMMFSNRTGPSSYKTFCIFGAANRLTSTSDNSVTYSARVEQKFRAMNTPVLRLINKPRASKTATSQTATPVPGAGLLGQAFDQFTLRPQGILAVKLSFDGSSCDAPCGGCWKNPSGAVFRVPDQACLTVLDTSSFNNGSFEFSDAKSLETFVERRTSSRGLFSSRSSLYQRFYQAFYEYDEAVTYSYAQRLLYQLTLAPQKVELMPYLLETVRSLDPDRNNYPTRLSDGSGGTDLQSINMGMLIRLMEDFGEHYIAGVKAGGEFSIDLHYHRCMISQFTREYREQHSRTSFIIGSHRSGNGQLIETLDSIWKEWASSRCQLSGGHSFSMDPPDMVDWLSTVADAPTGLEYELASWVDLLPDAWPQKAIIKEYIPNWKEAVAFHDRGYYEALASQDPRVNPEWCKSPF